MKVSVVAFRRNTDGKTVLTRGFTTIATTADLGEALKTGFGQHNVDEMFVQLGYQGKPESYSNILVSELDAFLMSYALDHPEIAANRLVKIVSPDGLILSRFWFETDVGHQRRFGVEYHQDDERFITLARADDKSKLCQ